MQIFSVQIKSDSVKPTVLKIISESKSKAVDIVKKMYYPFPKSRDNVIYQIVDTKTIGD